MSAGGAWLDANQRYLSAAVSTVIGWLQRHALQDAEGGAQAEEALAALQDAEADAHRALPAPSRLDVLCARCGLTPFERAIVLLCAGIELDVGVARACAALQGGHAQPTFGLALAALPAPHWEALAPAAPLRRARLIELTASDGLTQASLRIEERVLHHLVGLSYLDERLQPYLLHHAEPGPLPPSLESLALRAAQFWRGLRSGSEAAEFERTPDAPDGLIQLCGEDLHNAQAIAARTAALLDPPQPLYVMNAADLPKNLVEREALSQLWARESLLGAQALLLDCTEIGSPEILENAGAFADRLPGMLLVAAREPLPLRRARGLRIDVKKPSHAEQAVLWQEQLAARGDVAGSTVPRLVNHFHLSSARIAEAANSALARHAAGDTPTLDAAAWLECRSQARVQMEGLARRIESGATWDDLVLPDAAARVLRQITAQVRQRLRVYEEWGFARKGQRGLGITTLFAGPSGTGKTLAAEVLAGELGLDLYHVDLSQIVSKYIGETEKNLRRIFDAADAGGSVLLFDEADSLFGKRSEVKDSHDRYANIEVSYLLQRMEAYRGLAILTTNMKAALDDAFLRRLRFVVQFPFPDSAQRAAIWSRVFPADMPRGKLDLARLARLPLSGGNIRNIAMNAAFLAADRSEAVEMAHLVEATRSEFDKLERPFNAGEFGGAA